MSKSTKITGDDVDAVIANLTELMSTLPPRAYVEHAIKLYGHDMFGHAMGLMGFIVSHPFHKTFAQFGKMKHDAQCAYLDCLSSLSAQLCANHIIGNIFSVDELKSDYDLASDLSKSLMIIKYRDGPKGSIFWTATAREFRGGVFYCDYSSYDVIHMSSKLQRGAECVTNSQKSVVKTENWADVSDTDKFHPNQQTTMNALLDGTYGESITGFATSKCDGSMLAFGVYRGIRMKIMKAFVTVFGSEFVQKIANMSMSIDPDCIVVVASQGTIMLSTHFNVSTMETYMCDAMLGYIDRDDVLSDHVGGMSYVDVFSKYGYRLITDIIRLAPESCDDVDVGSSNVIFEAIVANCTDIFVNAPHGAKTHKEFALKYDHSSLYLLGMSIITDDTDYGVYVPHMLCDSGDAETWSVPMWWSIDGTVSVEDILKGMSRMIYTNSDEEYHNALDVFLSECPPANIDYYTTRDIHIHLEGLVLLTVVDGEHTIDDRRVASLDYAKAKTMEYYTLHKFYTNTLDKYLCLYKYSIARKFFPLLDRVYAVYNIDTFRGTLTTAFTALFTDIVNNKDALIASVEEPTSNAFKVRGNRKLFIRDKDLFRMIINITDAVHNGIVQFFSNYNTVEYVDVGKTKSSSEKVRCVKLIITGTHLSDVFIGCSTDDDILFIPDDLSDRISTCLSGVTPDDKCMKPFIKLIGNFDISFY
jgi:hypothetical protein